MVVLGSLLHPGIFMVLVTLGSGLQCPACERIHCSPRKPSQLTCKGGTSTGICGCCPTCAKVMGERCGGDFNYLGKCDRGLYCQIQDPQKFTDRQPEGNCVLVPSHIQDAPKPHQKCRPKCSPKFCREHPRAICSAIKVADQSRDCQFPCQHTSCQACRFIAEPKCKSCLKDDFRCLKRYGKCVKRQYCTKRKFPCRKQYNKKQEGRFQCGVPSCS
ncbi:uncharacterized protein LOC133202224 [Saccostrea echinata]|uniref:uncharacterized protein LOC133202224 n=1 Tax=Saccostrea echinata TaxID=191078 RepID=UPI002A83AEC9|nr:uncharacterized protein LOC133202224 [Saccostrea echinata]